MRTAQLMCRTELSASPSGEERALSIEKLSHFDVLPIGHITAHFTRRERQQDNKTPRQTNFTGA